MLGIVLQDVHKMEKQPFKVAKIKNFPQIFIIFYYKLYTIISILSTISCALVLEEDQ